MIAAVNYRGRLAPSPTGFLHRGHAATFFAAQDRARERGGTLVLRVEDLDQQRCKPEFRTALLEDLRWAGLRWQEGPDIGGPCGPYVQSERLARYREAWARLAVSGMVYPCTCTRRDVERALSAPHAGEQEPVYPGTCRPPEPEAVKVTSPTGVNWRFRAPVGEDVDFYDGHAGPQRFRVERDFGDFIVWRRDGVPAYQLAVVVDDALMRISEVVRGADLLESTAQQFLLYRALGFEPPAFFHCPLVTDPQGARLSKRAGAHSLRQMRADGVNPATLRP